MLVAKQVGPYKITGTIDNICFYKMDGQYYARQKSSLTGKRVKKDHAFAKTMQNSSLFGRASSLASQIKRSYPKEEQCLALYRQLHRKVLDLLKAGIAEAEIMQQLLFVFEEEKKTADTVYPKPVVTVQHSGSYRSVFALPYLSILQERKNRRIPASIHTKQKVMLNCGPP